MAELLNFNPNLATIVVVIASLAGIGLLIFGIVQATRGSNTVNKRMELFIGDLDKTSKPDNTIYRSLTRELSGSFFNRTIGPFFRKIINFVGKYTPANTIAKSNSDLRLAGNPFGMHAREFYGIRVLFELIGIGLALLIYFRSGPLNLSTLTLVLAIIILSIYLPRLWLVSKIRRRKDELSHNLPDALDMLSVCATAGLSFDQGLKKICEYWPTALNEEFKQMLQEMEMGVSRAEALRNLRERVQVDDLSSFVAIIIQAENVGMSISAILQSQAKQMRILRQFRAKEKANTLPAKMMIPVAAFIFPAILAVVLGPLVPQLGNLF